MQDTINQTPFYASLSDEQLNKALETARAEYEREQDELSRLGARLRKLGEEMAAMREVQAQRRMANMQGRDWGYLLGTEGFETEAKHKTLKAALADGIEPAEHRHIAVTSSGMFAEEPLQSCVQVALMRGCPELTASVTRKLAELLPAVAFHVPRKVRNEDTRPVKYIKLFEHTLSASASYYLAINEELGIYEVRSSRHGFERAMVKAENLEQLLKAAEDNFFYQDVNGRDD